MSDCEHRVEVQRWLRYAQEDLVAAEMAVGNRAMAARHACFLAQQAAEKALKAIFVFLRVDFPWRHDLEALRTLIPDDWALKADLPDLATLTEWAVEARYPGDWPDATEEDARNAVEQARAVWTSVLRDLAEHGFDAGDEG